MHAAMTNLSSNIFLGTPDNTNETVSPKSEHSYLDHGAVTLYNGTCQSDKWWAFTDFASLELLSIRKINDIELIKIMQNMGMQL